MKFQITNQKMESKSCSVIKVDFHDNGNFSVIGPKENNVIETNDTLNEPNAEVINADDTKPLGDIMTEPNDDENTIEIDEIFEDCDEKKNLADDKNDIIDFCNH